MGMQLNLLQKQVLLVDQMGFPPFIYCDWASYPVQAGTTIIYSNVSKNHIGT